jgi:hypothetical protein
MKSFSIWITPAFPLIGAGARHEFRATSEQHATQQAVARFPGHTFGMPRDVTPPGYSVANFLDSSRGFEQVSGFGLLPA